jgi:hypothetical protein
MGGACGMQGRDEKYRLQNVNRKTGIKDSTGDVRISVRFILKCILNLSRRSVQRAWKSYIHIHTYTHTHTSHYDTSQSIKQKT